MPDEKGSSRILSHWACYKTQQKNLSDDKIADDIRKKLINSNRISYASIAEKAVEVGRKELAIKVGLQITSLYLQSHFCSCWNLKAVLLNK